MHVEHTKPVWNPVFLFFSYFKKLIVGYTEKSTDVVVDFTVSFKNSEEISELVSENKLESLLKLSTSVRTSNMHAYGSINMVRITTVTEKLSCDTCAPERVVIEIAPFCEWCAT